MSTIMDGTRASGTTTETIGLTLCTGEGAEVLYSQDPNLTGSNQANPIHSGGEANGAVVAMLGVDGIAGSKEVRVESPRGQSDIETIERTIDQLSEVRDALRKTAASA